MTLSHPAAVLERLAAIDEDLGTRQLEYEQSAGDRAHLIRDWEKRIAMARRTAKASDADGRKAAALVMAAEQDDLYDRLTAAEDSYAALHAVIRVLETRATIGMAILKSQGRS